MPEEPKEGTSGLEGFAELIEKMAQARTQFEDEHGEIVLQSEFKYPLTVSKILGRGMPGGGKRAGMLVKVRPVNDRKTYLGIYLGNLLRDVNFFMGSKSNALFVTERANPAIWVPNLNRVVWGDSSWWAEIETEEDAKRLITDDDIQNVWYVKALKALEEKKEEGMPKGVFELKQGKKYQRYILARRVMAVAVYDEKVGDWAAYVDAVPGHRHEEEWQEVVDHGLKLPKRVAEVLFPALAANENLAWRD